MLEQCSNEQLVEELYTYAKRLAAGFAQRCPSVDRDEIESGAMLGVAFTVRSYDPAKGPLMPYARKRIMHYMLEALRRETGFRAKGHPSAFSEETQRAHDRSRALRRPVDIDDVGVTYADPAMLKNNDVEEQVVALDVLRGIVEATRKVTPQDLAMLVRVNGGTSGRAIAREIGISGTAVNKRVMKARQRIREHLVAQDLLEQDAA